MDSEQFRNYGKGMVDYISNYVKNIEQRDVAPLVEPGYLKQLIPAEAPQKGEKFENIMSDVEEKIMPGVLHWNHPNFFAYFPAGNSFPSILGDMLSSAIGSIGFSWASCPALTELEYIIMNWYAKALHLPKSFLSDIPGSTGGGALQGSASDCTLVSLMAARYRAIQKLKGAQTNVHDSVFLPQLIGYTSKEAHSSVEKAAKMALVKLRLIDADEHSCMRVDLLSEAIHKDIAAGLTPFFVCATAGTTGSCAFDDLHAIGKVCNQHKQIWYHVDGAYGGNTFILPEMRKFIEGLEFADSFNVNPNKLLLTNFDASALWVRDVMALQTALTVNPLYLQHEHDSVAIDYRHYGIPLSRRFRALKLWFVFRVYGINGIQAYIRNHMLLAKKFEALVKKDNRFEVRNDVHVGLVCFRMRTDDLYNQELLANLNHTGKIHMVPAMVNGRYTIRFCVTYEYATAKHIVDAWNTIKQHAEELLAEDILEVEPCTRAAAGSDTPTDSHSPLTPKPKLTRSKSRRFSFVRAVSRDEYQKNSEHLQDGATPILVVDESQLQSSFDQATDTNLKMRSPIDKTKSTIKQHAEELMVEDILEVEPCTRATAGSDTPTDSHSPLTPKPKLTRSKSRRFSFVRAVSRDEYQKNSEHLQDGATPILVVDQSQLQSSFDQATDTNLKVRSPIDKTKSHTFGQK